MKKLSDKDFLKWLQSDIKHDFIKSNNKLKKNFFPKPGNLSDHTIKKILKGKIKIESKIDLHGMGRYEAREKINSFIYKSVINGHRYINIITGKGTGVLRKTLVECLEDKNVYKYVISFSTAHRKQGGEGAFILHLRKKETIG